MHRLTVDLMWSKEWSFALQKKKNQRKQIHRGYLVFSVKDRNFMLLTLLVEVLKNQYSSFPLFPVAFPFRIAIQLQYYVKGEKCKVNDVILPSGCEEINLGNKNMKIGTSVRSKNIFTDSSRYPTGKHEIKYIELLGFM